MTFRYKDYKDDAKVKVMTLSGVEFVRRFLMHVPPKGFVRLILDGDIFEKNTLQEKYLKLAADAVADDPEKPVAQKIRNALGQDTGYVKVSESDWKKMLRIFRVTKTKDKAVEEMAKDMVSKDSKIKLLTDRLDKCKEFLQRHNLFEAFKEFIKPKEQKKERVSVRAKMAENKIILANQEPFRRIQEQDQHKKQQIAI